MSPSWFLPCILLASAAIAAEPRTMALRAHDRWVAAAAFRPAGDLLATCSDDQSVKVWQATTGELRWASRTSAALTALTWAVDGKQLFTGNWRGEVQVWDGQQSDGQQGELRSTWSAHAENIMGLAVSADGTLLATASGDDRCKVWEIATRRCLLTIEQDNEYDATCVAFSPDRKFIAVGDGENAVKLYRVSSGELLLTLAGHAEAVSAVVYSPDGKHIISGSADDTVRIWDTATGAELRKLEGHTDDVASLSLCDRKCLLSGGADGRAILWDLKTGNMIERMAAHPSAITAVALSPDGLRLAVGGQRELRLRELPR